MTKKPAGRTAKEIKETAEKIDKIIAGFENLNEGWLGLDYFWKKKKSTAPDAVSSIPQDKPDQETVVKSVPPVNGQQPTLQPLRTLIGITNIIFKKVPDLSSISIGTEFTMYNDEGWESTGNFVKYYGNADSAGKSITIVGVHPDDESAASFKYQTDREDPNVTKQREALQSKLDRVPQVRQLERQVSSIIPNTAYDEEEGDEKPDSNLVAWKPAFDNYNDYMEPAYLIINVSRKFLSIHLADLGTRWEVWEKFDLNLNPTDRGIRIHSNMSTKCIAKVAEYFGIDPSLFTPYKTVPSDVRFFK